MSRLSELELNKENDKLALDPELPVAVTCSIIAGWAGVVVQWLLYFFVFGKITSFDNWFLGGAIFCTLLVTGLTVLHRHRLKHNYNVFRKALSKKTIKKGLGGER